MSEKKSDNQKSIEAGETLIAEVNAQKKAEEEFKAQEQRIKQVQTEYNATMLDDKVSKADLASIIAEQNKKMDEMRLIVLKAKAQGKAHIVEENASDETEMVKMYGKDSKIGRLFAKK